jgi:hypothetical protein
MSSVMCNYLGNEVLTDYVKNGGGDGKGAWVGMFTNALTTAGDLASEVTGGDYERSRPLTSAGATGWSSPGSKTIGNAYGFHFTNLPDCTVIYLALITLAAGGDMMLTLELPVPKVFENGDDFFIDANALVFTL